jgi:hypothetical protein
MMAFIEQMLDSGNPPDWFPLEKRRDFRGKRVDMLIVMTLDELREAVKSVIEMHRDHFANPNYGVHEYRPAIINGTPDQTGQACAILARYLYAAWLGENDGLPVLMDQETADRVFKGDNYGKHQSQNASNPRARIKGITEESFSISHLVNELAKKADSLGDPLKSPDLWPELFALLVDRELEPNEYKEPPRYTFLKNDANERDEILYTSFKVMLSKARRC